MISLDKIHFNNWVKEHKQSLIATGVAAVFTATLAVSIYFCVETSKYNYWVQRSGLDQYNMPYTYEELVIDPKCGAAIAGIVVSGVLILSTLFIPAMIDSQEEKDERNHPSNRACDRFIN